MVRLRQEMGIPPSEVIICGMALGYEDKSAPENALVTERATASEFATFDGFWKRIAMHLPEKMLPAGWPRSKARRVFEDRHDAWHGPAQEYFRSLEGVQQPPRQRAA